MPIAHSCVVFTEAVFNPTLLFPQNSQVHRRILLGEHASPFHNGADLFWSVISYFLPVADPRLKNEELAYAEMFVNGRVSFLICILERLFVRSQGGFAPCRLSKVHGPPDGI